MVLHYLVRDTGSDPLSSSMLAWTLAGWYINTEMVIQVWAKQEDVVTSPAKSVGAIQINEKLPDSTKHKFLH